MRISEAENGKTSPFEGIEDWLRGIIREEVRADPNGHSNDQLLTPEQLAHKLNVPMSHVYEQSRQGKIPTHKIGRYLRFDFREVLASQKKID